MTDSTGSAAEAFLDDVPTRSAALVIEGPAGIGKSHRWTAVVDEACRRGWRVFRARPSQAETRLVGSALIDLFTGVTDDELARLPGPQHAALASALLRGTGDDAGAADPRAVAVSCATLLRELAADGPVLLAVDDIQWLDPETASALAFVARRLPERGLGMLLAWRTERRGGAEPELVGAVADVGVRLPVRPLEPAACERVVLEQLARPVPGAVIRRAVQVSAGNPLYAVEVARALVHAGPGSSYDEVPLPPSLHDVIGAHLHALPDPARMALAAAAALTRPTVRHLRPLGLEEALVAAERAGLAEVSGIDVRFSHPLFAAAAYDGLVGSERSRLHTRLADVVEEPEERARHLALGIDGPDAQVAAVLDDARERALRRGAPHAAIDACRLALRATPPGDPALSARRLALGNLLFRAGDTDEARRELEVVAATDADPMHRATALYELARLTIDSEAGSHAADLAYEALELAGDTPLAADIHVILTLARYDDFDAGLEHARAAIALLDRQPDPDPGKLSAALAALAETSFRAGLGLDHAACRRAIELEAETVPPPVCNRAIMGFAFMLMYADELDEARRCFLEAHRMAVEEGDHGSLPEAVGHLALLELWSGDWEGAERYAREGLGYAQRIGQDVSVMTARWDLGWVQAHTGRIAEAEETGKDLVALSERAGDVATEMWGRALLGFCALARGDAATAVEELSRHAAVRAGTHSREPGFYWIGPHYVEALVASGRLDDARAVLASYEAEAAAVGRRSSLAAAARCRALLLAASGAPDAAVAAADDAIEQYDALQRDGIGRPFDRANALLAKGQVHRRFKQKALARTALSEALAIFERLGSPDYAERARAELSRVGLRPPAPLHLTETEQRIAELTAQGMTTKEVAAALFLSPRTVAGNLTRVYRKLDVRNRAELVTRLQSVDH
ncbi:MAG TPA: AAA family ATPase [Kribbellaceae bacterium]